MSAASALRRVLAVCSGAASEAGMLAAAADFAARNGAALSILSVIAMPADSAEMAHAAGLDLAEVEARLVSEHRVRVEALARDLRPADPPPVTIRVGKPFFEIIRHVIEVEADFVVKTAERLSGMQRFLFASDDQHLLRKCPCPVWLRRPEGAPAWGPILAAVDVDLADAEEPETLEGLNRRVIDVAARLARGSERPVTVLHAWDAPGEALVRRWSSGPDAAAAAEAYVTASHAARATALRALTQGAGTDGVTLHPLMERGEPRRVIAAQAEALGADLLVIGTLARTGARGVLIGNTAEDVLNSVGCSVAAVKPPGFVTPLSFD